MKVLLLEQYNNQQPITVYHGGGINQSNSRLIYYSTNYKYAKWFADHNSYKKDGIIIEKTINTSNFLDLTQYGYGKISQYNFRDILQGANVHTPHFITDNINCGLGNYKCHIWQFFTEPMPNDDLFEDFNLFWDDISSKYDGINILENNPEARHLGVSNTFIIDTKYNSMK